MKTLFTKSTYLAIISAAVLFTGTANAKIDNAKNSEQKIENTFGFDVVAEISGFIKSTMGDSPKPSVRAKVQRQLASDSVKLRTSQMANSFNKDLPKVKVAVQK
jgi:hypothetical protein